MKRMRQALNRPEIEGHSEEAGETACPTSQHRWFCERRGTGGFACQASSRVRSQDPLGTFSYTLAGLYGSRYCVRVSMAFACESFTYFSDDGSNESLRPSR